MDSFPTETTIDAWVMLHRANRKLLEEVGAALKRHGLPPLDWYDVLLELRRAGNDGLRQFEVGDRILLSKHNLSRLIDRLEKQNLVRRHATAEDGRGNRIKITNQGKEVLRKVWPVYAESIQREFGDKLNVREASQLARLLGKLMR